MLCAIAKATGAGTLVSMLQTCKSWRATLLASEDEIWKELALERFPWLHSILDAVPMTHSYRELYRVQVSAKRVHDLFQYNFMPPKPALGPEMSEYIFSYELWHYDKFIGETSGDYTETRLLRLHEKFTTGPQLALLRDMARLCLSPEIPPPIIIRASVTRRADLSTIVLCQVEVFSASYKACRGSLEFDASFVPTTWAPMIRHDDDHQINDFAARLVYTPTMTFDGTDIEITGSFMSADEYGSDEPKKVSEADVRMYLAHLAPWPAGLSSHS